MDSWRWHSYDSFPTAKIAIANTTPITMPKTLFPLLFALISAAHVATVEAQTASLPSATRTVFKCVVDGKASYSDAPCLGAQRIDIAPTRGMNKSTGKELSGSDVNRERQNEIIGEAFRPITGMSLEQRATHAKRFNLSVGSKSECGALDSLIARTEAAERAENDAGKSALQGSLLQSRMRYREIGC